MKVLRLTRHPMVPEQRLELARIFGPDLEIVEVSETVPDAARVKQVVAEHAPDILEAVLPLSLMAEVLNPANGVKIPVIRAITRRELASDGTKAAFIFSHYEKMIRVEVIAERL